MFRGFVCVANSQLYRRWGQAPLGRLHDFTLPQIKHNASRLLFNTTILSNLKKLIPHRHIILYTIQLKFHLCFWNSC